MRRYVITPRITCAAPPDEMALYLRPATLTGQRLHLYELEIEPASLQSTEMVDAYGNVCTIVATGGREGLAAIVATSVVSVTPRPPSAFDRPWEHAVIDRIGRSRHLDRLARQVAGPVTSRPPAHLPLRALIERAEPSQVADHLAAAGLAIRRTYGYRLTRPAPVRGYALFTPDHGWCAIDTDPMVTLAWSPIDVDLWSHTPPDAVSELDIIRQ